MTKLIIHDIADLTRQITYSKQAYSTSYVNSYQYFRIKPIETFMKQSTPNIFEFTVS